MSDKPTVFNYMKYQAALDEIERLREKVATLEIKCRILEEDKPGLCKDCYACETRVTRYEEGDLYDYYCLRGKHKEKVDADHYCSYWEEGEDE